MRISHFLQLLVAIVLCQLGHSYANEPEVKLPRFEVYVGSDYYGRSVSLYSTSIWSIAGPVTEPGFRLRADGLASLYGETNARFLSNAFLPASTSALGDLMAGYQYNRGSLWLKFYGGVAFQGQTRLFWDAGQQNAAQSWGAKAAVESWWRPTSRVWTSVDLSWLELNKEITLHSRVAYDIGRFENGASLSLGSEIGATRADADVSKEGKRLDQYANFTRAGPLLNLRFGANELSFSGGVAQSSGDANWRPYATLSYGRKF